MFDEPGVFRVLIYSGKTLHSHMQIMLLPERGDQVFMIVFIPMIPSPSLKLCYDLRNSDKRRLAADRDPSVFQHNTVQVPSAL